jgi:SIT family siderophore-iron:H+ symporter-like MFS transporter
MASIQAAVPYEHLAVITGAYFATYRIGAAIGSAIAATIWNHIVHPKLFQGLSAWFAAFVFSSAVIVADGGFCDTTMPTCPAKTDIDMVIEVYKRVQRWLCVVAAITCVPLILFTFVIKNPKLGELQSLETSEVPQVLEMHPQSKRDGVTPRSHPNALLSGTFRPPQTPGSAQTDESSGTHIPCEPHSTLGKGY